MSVGIGEGGAHAGDAPGAGTEPEAHAPEVVEHEGDGVPGEGAPAAESGHGMSMSVAHWINDLIMAIFFLLVGMEIKREVREGELSSFKKAALPVMAALGGMMGLGAFYWVGWLVVVALLIYEHSLVRPGDLSRLDMAFFNVNGYIAVIVLVAVVTGLWHR